MVGKRFTVNRKKGFINFITLKSDTPDSLTTNRRMIFSAKIECVFWQYYKWVELCE
jgi:hypothetical protein